MTRPQSSLREAANPFLLDEGGRSYKHQFANLYFARLHKLRGDVLKQAKAKWASTDGAWSVHVPKVLEVSKGQRSYIVGTLYMEMRLKPNVLDDIGHDHNIVSTTVRDKIYSDEDALMLEDESGRIKLIGDALSKYNLVTGVIVAALGCENIQGEFEVADLCFTAPAPRASLKSEDAMDVDSMCSSEVARHVALISGLDFGEDASGTMALELLLEFLSSELGDAADQSLGRSISRLIIIGNSFAPLPEDEDGDVRASRLQEASELPFLPVGECGQFLLDACVQMPVHLMPGPSDPTSATLPQQPIPSAVFGPVHGAENLRCETNPCSFDIDECSILAIAGQNIDDICRYSANEDRLAIARDTLRWRHIAPTAPDTLWCYPFVADDPFVLKESPHVYAIGNQAAFQTDIVKDEAGNPIRVVLVPRFSKTGTLVLLNTKTLEVRPISFQTSGWPLSS
ncbi:hypothetical protein AURDEDRAFT_54409 [Auricularia subglabra TFB-10046 SS5]|nr:hypothetical protein AURDEDRAFT_54409 [Auricularia subglabra TFB-10046 SS5]